MMSSRAVVSEEGGLGVGGILQPVEGVEERVVAIVGEAGRKGGDVDEEVWLDDYYAGDDVRERRGGSGGGRIFFNVAVEQVQLHAWPEQLLQVGEVAAVLGVAVVNGYLSVVGVGQNVHVVHAVDNAAQIFHVDAQTLGAGPVVSRQEAQQHARHVGLEDGGDEACHGHDVVRPVFSTDGCAGVGMAAGRLQADAQLGVQPQPLAKVVHLREEVAECPTLSAAAFGSGEHQHLVQAPGGRCARRALCQRSADVKQFRCYQIPHSSLFILHSSLQAVACSVCRACRPSSV